MFSLLNKTINDPDRYAFQMYSATFKCRDLFGAIIKQPVPTAQSQRAQEIQGGYVIPNQSGAITHMLVEKDEKQLLTAGYLLGLNSPR